MVSFRDAMWPEMAAGRLKWPDYIVDTKSTRTMLAMRPRHAS